MVLDVGGSVSSVAVGPATRRKERQSHRSGDQGRPSRRSRCGANVDRPGEAADRVYQAAGKRTADPVGTVAVLYRGNKRHSRGRGGGVLLVMDEPDTG